VVPWQEHSVFAVKSGTRHIAIGYPNDLLNRTSTGIPKKPTVVDRAWETGRNDLHDQKIKNLWRFLMPSRNESMRARERLESETPVCDDAALLKLDEEVGEYVREAKRRDAPGSDELVSTVVDEVARNYFRYILRKQARVTPVQRRTRA
jgi:hypothetical protein